MGPADVKVIGAVGDSLTAGNGIGSSPKDLLDVLTQYRGLSWSVGGDESLSTVTTLPNILRQFNTSLKGFSLGTGKVNSSNTFLNQAVSGSTTIDIPGQIRKLVDIMKSDQRINFQSDWKVVTLFIGGNDLCNSCIDKRVTRELVESGRYDTRDDFTVVLQPFFREVQIPLLPDGRPDSSYFTADCFHLSQKTQSQIARALWNNMLQPVGNKSTFQNLTTAVSLSCPTQADPFLRTYKNSNYSYPGPVPTQAPIKNFGSDLSCLDRAPSENIPTSDWFWRSSKQSAQLADRVERAVLEDVNFQNDWKLVTVFIGGNDLCNYCNDRETYSVENYMRYIQDSLDILYREVPRVFVNLVMVLQIEGLRRIKSNTLGCTLLQTNLCPCSLVPGEDSLELSELKKINREYQEVTERLVSSGRYDGRQDFTVVVQPFFRNSIIPLTIDGKPDLDFFSVDCFHFKERGQAEMSIELWNNMLEPVGQKHTFNNFTHDRSKLKCPSQERPYFFTQMNSFPDANPTAVSPAPPNVGPVDSVDTVPQWLAAVTAAVGLLVGAVLAGFLVSWKAKVSLKQKEKELEMKQTTF
ncbi:Phospholipase B1, membrane-associated [Acipenser ruthenus]|uniref:Phospholipase B1, membrane-associated n=1 Tax=Acipenser ruthenus TaxID=7906 RepID=A0A444UQ55_ACIRT|nr:Phospholipase B1, membrane-associated [Acipenser ruthenus]